MTEKISPSKSELLLIGFYTRNEITFTKFNLKINLVAIGFSWEEAQNEIGFLLQKKYIREGGIYINEESTVALATRFLDRKVTRGKNVCKNGRNIR